jgi:hypothetical protein
MMKGMFSMMKGIYGVGLWVNETEGSVRIK